jgi:hypothetical protein
MATIGNELLSLATNVNNTLYEASHYYSIYKIITFDSDKIITNMLNSLMNIGMYLGPVEDGEWTMEDAFNAARDHLRDIINDYILYIERAQLTHLELKGEIIKRLDTINNDVMKKEYVQQGGRSKKIAKNLISKGYY